eukprot:1162018-Pelagomonas_calceolata.AAC.16
MYGCFACEGGDQLGQKEPVGKPWPRPFPCHTLIACFQPGLAAYRASFCQKLIATEAQGVSLTGCSSALVLFMPSEGLHIIGCYLRHARFQPTRAPCALYGSE